MLKIAIAIGITNEVLSIREAIAVKNFHSAALDNPKTGGFRGIDPNGGDDCLIDSGFKVVEAVYFLELDVIS